MNRPRIRVVDAATTCRIPARTIRRWIAQGRLTAVRSGREYLIDPLELDQLAEMRDTRSGGRLPTNRTVAVRSR